MSGSTYPAPVFRQASVNGQTSIVGASAYVPTDVLGPLVAMTYGKATVTGEIGPAAGQNAAPFSFNVTNSGVNGITSQGLWGAVFTHSFQGTQGGVGGIRAFMQQTGPTADAAGHTFFINPMASYLDLEFSPTAGAFGNGLAFSSQCFVGVPGFGLVEGAEIAVSRVPGATVTVSAVAALLMESSNNATSGIDCFLAFGSSAKGTTGALSLLQLGRGGGDQWPLDNTNGWIMAVQSQQTNNAGFTQRLNQVAAGGFDLFNVNMAGSYFRSSGTNIEAASIKVGYGQLFADTNGARLDPSGTIGAIASVAAPGALYQVNDQLFDGKGGVIKVTAVDGGGGITAASYVVGREPYFFGGGPALTGAFAGSGNGQAQFNLTWTAKTRLTLNQTGGLTAIGGTLQVTGACTFTAGNIVAGANAASFVALDLVGAVGNRYLSVFTGTTSASGHRWDVGADNTAEGGANVGSDFVVKNYDDAGAQINTPLRILRATGQMRLGAGNQIANGSVATVLGSVGPVGSHTAVQEWLAVQNASGVVRYVPCF